MMQSIAKVLSGLVMAGVATGCATMQFAVARHYGPDSMVVQYDGNGKPTHCWKLKNTTLSAQPNGNLEWKDLLTNNMVHLTSWVSYVKVERQDYDAAAKVLGVDADRCEYGVYVAEPPPAPVPVAVAPVAPPDPGGAAAAAAAVVVIMPEEKITSTPLPPPPPKPAAKPAPTRKPAPKPAPKPVPKPCPPCDKEK